jgi:hypothetical protein
VAGTNSRGDSFDQFRTSWRFLLPFGVGLFWLGRSVLTPEQIDNRVSVIVRPLQDNAEWLRREQIRIETQITKRLSALERVSKFED